MTCVGGDEFLHTVLRTAGIIIYNVLVFPTNRAFLFRVLDDLNNNQQLDQLLDKIDVFVWVAALVTMK